MLPDGARRLIRDFGLKPGERAVVIAADDRGVAAADELEQRGRPRRHDASTCASASPPTLAAEGRRGVLAAVTIDGARHECDLLLASGTPQPAYSLLAQAGARVEYDAGARHLRPARPAARRRGGRPRDRRARRGRARRARATARTASSASARTSASRT